jgi:hypothetical protein
MKISPFTPLCFEPYVSDGLPSRYVQLWAPTDHILVQVLADSEDGEPDAELVNAVTGDTIDTISWQSWQMNTDKVLYFCDLSGLSVGYYKLVIEETESDVFRVTDDTALLARTSLLQYRFKDNKQRDDVVSVIDGVPHFFDFRVPGGFKDSGWGFGVTNEQFATQHADLVELYARDYITKTFSLGGPEGVPVWYGALLNRLLTCSYIYIDGERYTRNESETPAMQTLVEGVDSFVFTQVLRRVSGDMEEAANQGNHVMLRRVSGSNVRIVDNSNLLIIEQTQL